MAYNYPAGFVELDCSKAKKTTEGCLGFKHEGEYTECCGCCPDCIDYCEEEEDG